MVRRRRRLCRAELVPVNCYIPYPVSPDSTGIMISVPGIVQRSNAAEIYSVGDAVVFLTQEEAACA